MHYHLTALPLTGPSSRCFEGLASAVTVNCVLTSQPPAKQACTSCVLIACSSALCSPCSMQDEARKAAGEAWYKTMISDSDYTEFEIFGKWLGVTQ